MSYVALLFASDESPHLIALDILHRHLADPILKQPLAAVPGQYQNLEDGYWVNASDPLNRTNRATLDEEANDRLDFLRSRVHSAEMLIQRVGVRLVALTAPITLLAFPGLSKLAAFDLAVVARHFDSCFLRASEPE